MMQASDFDPDSPAAAPRAGGAGTALLGVVDFSYQHYALGDLLTTQVDLATIAIERKLEHVDIVAYVNPGLPSARIQGFITPENYVTHYDALVPVFTCNPMLRRLDLVRDPATFSHIVLTNHRGGGAMWPTFRAHLRMRQSYPLGHARVNAFHARYGYLPRLTAPRHYEGWARDFHGRELKGRPLVVINPRQSSLTSDPGALYRDAQLSEWHAFIDAVVERAPEVLFVAVGGYQEWEHRLLHRANVFVPRAVGLALAHELALMKIAALFMGSSSGFATFATFTDIPYAILNFEHRFAPHGAMTAGDRHYPFAHANQVITWQPETCTELLALFEELLAPVDAAAAPARTTAEPAAKGA
jgi:hypothetical protein